MASTPGFRVRRDDEPSEPPMQPRHIIIVVAIICGTAVVCGLTGLVAVLTWIRV